MALGITVLDYVLNCLAILISFNSDESKTPTTQWRKAEIQEWLTSKGKIYKPKDTKVILLSLAKEVFVRKEYVLERLTQDFCIESGRDIQILRLPIGHSELNPIELIWAQVKNEVARKNRDFNITGVQKLVEEALGNVTAGNWKKVIAHTHKVEAAFRRIDFGEENIPPTVDRMIIEVSSLESDEESSEDCFYSDEDEDVDFNC